MQSSEKKFPNARLYSLHGEKIEEILDLLKNNKLTLLAVYKIFGIDYDILQGEREAIVKKYFEDEDLKKEGDV